ncbi:hypothetical protein CYMTET_30697 [Cymbomonas tetramitiformis]|uniref:Uncharacterized protein n=1 Tax=Cymbomonas tetramitiformis TaxID=36881 RepID=A0AAE0FIB7_9CHLO|nr:hypothetical protein CYMTET_30697 [Cymbomonas tetramitiformis]
MVSRNDHLIIWTSSVAKTKLRKLRQHLKVSARMRLESWKKERQQILDWQQHRLHPGAKRKQSDYKWNRDEEAVVEAVVAEVAAVAVAFRMSATATTVATADTSLTAISGMCAMLVAMRVIHEAPAGAEEFPVVVPGPAVEVDMAPVVETEVEGEATLVKRARVELESEVPMGGLASKRCLYIKMQGDWKSDCFERYCELDTEQKLVLPGAMAEAAAALL